MKDSVEIITLKKDQITDFAKERNTLLSKAKKDWILFVDSDEIVTPELSHEIENLDLNQDGYFIRRKNYFLGSYIGEDRIIRLARKNSGKWKRRVHETWQVKGRVGELKNSLIHNTANNLSEYLKKINYYSTLHARTNEDEGKKSSIFKIIFYPKIKFVLTLIKSKNVVFSLMQSFHSFLSWSNLYLWQRKYR